MLLRYCATALTNRSQSRTLVHREVSSHFFFVRGHLGFTRVLFRFVTAERKGRRDEVTEEVEGDGLKKGKREKEPTVRPRASAASDVGSDTFGRSGPEFYLPSEGETDA